MAERVTGPYRGLLHQRVGAARATARRATAGRCADLRRLGEPRAAAGRTTRIASRRSSISDPSSASQPKTRRSRTSSRPRANTSTACCKRRDASHPSSPRRAVRRREWSDRSVSERRGRREIGPEATPALFVSWRTGGVANHPGNIAWGVHYRFDAQVLRDYPHLSEERAAARMRARARNEPAARLQLRRSAGEFAARRGCRRNRSRRVNGMRRALDRAARARVP